MSQIPPPPSNPYGPGSASGSPQGAPQGYGQPVAGQVPPQEKKRWPLFVGIGCGCLALIAIVIVVIVIVVSMNNGGDGEETTAPTTETTTVEETTPEETTPEETTSEATTPEETTPETTPAETTTDVAGAVTDADKSAAGQRFYDFMQAIGASDWSGTCAFLANPITMEPMSDAEIAGCASGMESAATDSDMESFETLAGLMTVDSVTAEETGDGGLEMYIYGTSTGIYMIKASDGSWYVDSSQFT